MKIEVRRFIATKNSTISRVYVDGVFYCYGLEDIVRKPVVYVRSATAIPPGTYRLVYSYSPRFKIFTPRLLDQVGTKTMFGLIPLDQCGILIHVGNYPKDTDGCLLLGSGYVPDMVTNSAFVIKKFYKLVTDTLAKKELITITIK